MRLLVGHSDAVDCSDAVDQVLASCREQIAGETPVAAVVFSSVSYDSEEVLRGVNNAWPGLPVVGCTTDGELSSEGGFSEDSLVVGLLLPFGDGGDLRVSTGAAGAMTDDLEAAVNAAIDQAVLGNPREQPKLCLLFINPFGGAQDIVASIVSDRLGCPVIGGGAGDHRTTLGPPGPKQFNGTTAFDDAVSLMLVYGDVQLANGVASGWVPVGPTYTVTRAEGPVVYEVDGVPMLEKFPHIFAGDSIANLGSSPTAILEGDGYLMRAVWAVDREDGSVTYAGTVAQGSKIRLTEALRGGILEGTRTSVGEAIDSYPGVAPQGAFIVNCAARKWVMGARAHEEVDVVSDRLGGLPYLGFYAFGEIAQLGDDSVFHNHSCCSLVFGAL